MLPVMVMPVTPEMPGKDVIARQACFQIECERGDLNPYSFRNQILNLAV